MKLVRRRIVPAAVVFGANAGSLQTEFQDRGELSARGCDPPNFRCRTYCATAWQQRFSRQSSSVLLTETKNCGRHQKIDAMSIQKLFKDRTCLSVLSRL